MAYPYRPFLQPSKARLVLHPELGRPVGRFPPLSETVNISETVCVRFAERNLPLCHSMPLQQSLLLLALISPIAENTCRHIAVDSVFDRLWVDRMFEEDCRRRVAVQL